MNTDYILKERAKQACLTRASSMQKVISIIEDGETLHTGLMSEFIKENNGLSTEELEHLTFLKLKEQCVISSGQSYVLVERIK